jgi:hypothetical protein
VVAQLLPLYRSGVHVFHAAVVAIVFSLAIGQDASVLCRTWCGDAVAASGCHHKNTSAPRSVKSNDDCGQVGTDSAVLVREDLRPDRHYQAAQHVVVIPSYEFPSSMGDAQARRGSSLQPPPLMIALRI